MAPERIVGTSPSGIGDDGLYFTSGELSIHEEYISLFAMLHVSV